MTLLSGPGLHGGCTEVARGCTGAATSLRLGTVPRLHGGARRGGSVQVELSQEALMLRVLRDRSQAGRLELDGDPVHRQAGPGCRPGGAGRRRVPRGSRLRLPRGRGTGSRRPCSGTSWTGAAIPRPGPPRPGESGPVPAFRFDVAHVPSMPVQRISHTPPSTLRRYALIAITILALHASASPGALLTRAGRTPRCWRPR